eukprot:gb/GECG01001572.1/.p1 GENE.gb/GECG01001572.1/~~gb/GECG01001572.1/.p1  ORF type:complete len:357 (+),score=59.04 gb/GECG01001572.1/:1-1071(+)
MPNEKTFSLETQQELLDELMGPNRNEDKHDSVVDDFTDPRVCKFYLLGLCPYTMFKNTKSDLGDCPYKVCNDAQAEQLKRKYEEASKTESFGYEPLLMKELEKLMRRLDKKIENGKRRLEDTGEGTAQQMDLESKPEMMELTRKIEEKVQQSEKAGEEGNVDESMQLMDEAEELKKQKAETQAQLMRDYAVPPEFQGNKQMLRVCEVCAAYLSSRDSDERLAEHFAGKIHLGFLKIRSKLKELREKLINEGYDPDKGILPKPKFRRSPDRDGGGREDDRGDANGSDRRRYDDSRDDRRDSRRGKRDREHSPPRRSRDEGSSRRSRDDDREKRRRRSRSGSRSRRSRHSRSHRRSRD